MAEDYKLTEEFQHMTPQEQKWFEHYNEFHDLKQATLASYKTTPDAAHNYGKTVAARPHIRTLIDRYCRIATFPSVDELRLRYLKIADMGEGDPKLQLQALVAYERLSGFNKRTVVKDDDSFSPLDDING